MDLRAHPLSSVAPPLFPTRSAMCFDTTQNINRAIKKASEGNVGDFAESTFEAYGFGGASFVINVLSDNNNRATSDVKSCVNKRNGKIAEQGSVLFMYDRRGKLEVDARLDEESLMEAAIEAGCEDMELLEVSVLELVNIESNGHCVTYQTLS
jgi:transcriptional/translational regulatory protein YebC/TACO1